MTTLVVVLALIGAVVVLAVMDDAVSRVVRFVFGPLDRRINDQHIANQLFDPDGSRRTAEKAAKAAIRTGAKGQSVCADPECERYGVPTDEVTCGCGSATVRFMEQRTDDIRRQPALIEHIDRSGTLMCPSIKCDEAGLKTDDQVCSNCGTHTVAFV